jgi:hypothetical protein
MGRRKKGHVKQGGFEQKQDSLSGIDENTST